MTNAKLFTYYTLISCGRRKRGYFQDALWPLTDNSIVLTARVARSTTPAAAPAHNKYIFQLCIKYFVSTSVINMRHIIASCKEKRHVWSRRWLEGEGVVEIFGYIAICHCDKSAKNREKNERERERGNFK